MAKRYPTIHDIDHRHADPMDIVDMQETKCINCGRFYNGYASAVFVRLSNGFLMWWHKHSCQLKKK